MKLHLFVIGLVALGFEGAGRAGGQAAAEATSEDVRLKTGGTTLAGTFLLPPASPPWPVVVIIAGSGPTDRDGNSAALPGKNNSHKQLAEALAAEGIASLRYDKRAIAASRDPAIREVDLRFDDYVADASGLVSQLKNDKRFSSVTVAGHSEGSLVGMMAAARAGASAFVSLEGAGRKASVILKEQLRVQIGAIPALWDPCVSVIDALESGKTVDPLPEAIAKVPGLALALFRPSVQPYLVSWFKYDPAAEIAKLAVPILIVQGTTDVQVPAADATLLAQAAPKATVRMVTGMNHILKKVEGTVMQQAPSYSDPSLPIAPEVPKAVAALVRSLR